VALNENLALLPELVILQSALLNATKSAATNGGGTKLVHGACADIDMNQMYCRCVIQIQMIQAPSPL
jgi:hypothetical protein